MRTGASSPRHTSILHHEAVDNQANGVQGNRPRKLVHAAGAAGSWRSIHTHPRYASSVKPIPRKTTKEGLDFLRRRLVPLVPGLASYSGRLDDDRCDALVAAHTAYLHALGRTEAVGLQEEVCITLPRVMQLALLR